MDESTDNENYNGDSRENADEDNVSFVSNDLILQPNQQQEEEHNGCQEQQHSSVHNNHRQQQSSPFTVEKNMDQECTELQKNSSYNIHNSHENTPNLNEVKIDEDEVTNKEDIPMNTYLTNGNQQSKDIHSNGYQQEQQQQKMSRLPGTTTKACAKKSFVWKYFHHPEIKHGIPDRSRTQCILCDSQLAFNASGTTTTMLNHLKSRHGEVAEQEENLRRFNRDSRKNQLRNMILSSNDKTPPTSPNTGNTMLKNNEMVNSLNENVQTTRNLLMNNASGNNKYSRGTLSVGQRGRPPGSGRRQKSTHCSKTSDHGDFLTQDTMSNGNLKSDGNPAYPLTNYQGILSDQQKAFLNEVLLSAAAASASTASLPRGDNRIMNAGFINQTSSPSAASSPPFFASSTQPTQITTESVSTKSPFTFLNGMTGFPNIPFHLPMNTPQISCTTGATTTTTHELSPSSSSGLGLSSVNSPFETPTTANTTIPNGVLMSSSSSSSPSNSIGYRSITSPAGCGGQPNVNSQNNLAVNPRTLHKPKECSHMGDNHLQTNNILMNGQSFNLADHCISGSQDANNLAMNMQNVTQDREKVLDFKNENNENIFDLTHANKIINPSTTQSTGTNANNVNSSSMLDCSPEMMMSAFGNFVNLIPSVNNLLNENTTNNIINSSVNDATTISRSEGTNISSHSTSSHLQQAMIHSMSPPQQQHQQLLMANAWLASLANGKFPNYPNNLVDPCVMFNLLNLNAHTMGNGFNRLPSVPAITSADSNCSESLKFRSSSEFNPPINSFSSDNSFPMNYLMANQNKRVNDDTMMNWSNTGSSVLAMPNSEVLKNESCVGGLSKIENVSSPFQFNGNLGSTGMSLTSNQQSQQQIRRSIQDGQNTNLPLPISLPVGAVGNYSAASGISLNENDIGNDRTGGNNNNTPCMLPSLTYQSMGQDKFSYTNTASLVSNGMNKGLQVRGQEVNEVSLDLSRTSNTSNIDNNNNNNNLCSANSPCNNAINSGLSKNVNMQDEMNCVLDMRSNNHFTDPKYSSSQQESLSPALSSSANYTVSTKRKRARPVYISPEQELKHCPTESNSTLEGEDMRMKRYHIENVHYNNNSNEVSPNNDKRSSWKSKKNVENIQENEENDSDEDHKMATSQSSSSSSAAAFLTSNVNVQAKFGANVTRNELSYYIAQYLIKDLKPLETIEGEGFRTLLSLFTNHELPTTKEISEVTFQELFSKVDNHLNQLLANRITESNLKNPVVSFSIELWSTSGDNNENNSSEHCSLDKDRYFANIGVHYTSDQPTTTHNYLYKCLQDPNNEALCETIQKCREILLSKTNLSSKDTQIEISATSPETVSSTPISSCETVLRNKSMLPTTSDITAANVNMTPSQIQSLHKIMEWPYLVVTNHPESLKGLINETESNILILPCLVSELSKALLAGLNTDMIRDLVVNLLKVYRQKFKKYETETLALNSSVQEMKKSHCCKAVYDLLKWYIHQFLNDRGDCGGCESQDEGECDSATIKTDLKTIEGIISVLETIGQTLEFIHKKDLVLTGSMIQPILSNLCDIRLANESSNSTAVEELKSKVVSSLMNSFPNNGQVYETLWIASLLDPRFKSQVQEKQPSVIKLLKTKVDFLSNQSTTNSSNNSTLNADGQLQHFQLTSDNTHTSSELNPSSNKHGLETVFGLNYSSRTSLSEVDRYIREDPIGLEEDPYLWWRTKSANYPNLCLLAMYYLAIPLTCISPERLKPMTNSGNVGTTGQYVPDINLNLLTTIYEAENRENFPSSALMLLDLPNTTDMFGQERLSIKTENQIMYNYLWHNWHLTKFV
ncbi:unnamed protein product [Trichobilharzia szidati]|nr:unnamed protein product [Trichobilharzia szidati]